MSLHNPLIHPDASRMPGVFDGVGGMTLRDYFAGQALLVMQMKAEEVALLLEGKEPNRKRVAEFCYSMAEAMLKAR